MTGWPKIGTRVRHCPDYKHASRVVGTVLERRPKGRCLVEWDDPFFRTKNWYKRCRLIPEAMLVKDGAGDYTLLLDTPMSFPVKKISRKKLQKVKFMLLRMRLRHTGDETCLDPENCPNCVSLKTVDELEKKLADLQKALSTEIRVCNARTKMLDHLRGSRSLDEIWAELGDK